MYKWKKLGLIFKPNSELWWSKTHCMVPTLDHLDDSTYKIYFSGRDDQNISHIGYFIIELNSPKKILDVAIEPVLYPGERGCFDDNGVTPSCIVKYDNKIYLYYIGWNPGYNVRMHLFGGLAISEDNGKSFQRYSRAPILERTRVNPFLNTAPFVLKEKQIWRMYYVAGTEWVHMDLPRYNIQYATSKDGLEWHRSGRVVINYKNDQEMALARPWVIKDKGIYKMWFSFKNNVTNGESYRIGYAESKNGLDWVRMDEKVGITISDEGWDSEMIEYAALVPYRDQLYMFYNGNNYGNWVSKSLKHIAEQEDKATKNA